MTLTLVSEQISTKVIGYERYLPYGWTILELASVESKSIKKGRGNSIGVYIIGSHKKISMVKGKSTIIYIGSGYLRSRLISILDFSFLIFLSMTKRKHAAKAPLQREADFNSKPYTVNNILMG